MVVGDVTDERNRLRMNVFYSRGSRKNQYIHDRNK
jgi:hypothetical protein